MLYLDLDGTVLDVTKRHYATYVEILGQSEMRGLPLPEPEYWALRRRGVGWKEILQKSRLLPMKFAAFSDRFDERFESPEMLAMDTVREGTVTALGKLYTKTPICLVTLRRDEDELKNQLASVGLAKYFTTVLCGAPPKTRRPDPDLRWKTKADHVRQRYRILPTDTLYIGDTETDVKAARSLAFEVWLVEGGHRLKEQQIKADPDRIVADLTASLKHLLPGGRWQR